MAGAGALQLQLEHATGQSNIYIIMVYVVGVFVSGKKDLCWSPFKHIPGENDGLPWLFMVIQPWSNMVDHVLLNGTTVFDSWLLQQYNYEAEMLVSGKGIRQCCQKWLFKCSFSAPITISAGTFTPKVKNLIYLWHLAYTYQKNNVRRNQQLKDIQNMYGVMFY